MEKFSTKVGKFVIESAIFLVKFFLLATICTIYKQHGNLALFGTSFVLVLLFDIRTRLGRILDKMSEKD